MTWREAQQAFVKQVPVVMSNPSVHRKPIRCSRISELIVRMELNGEKHYIVGGMDPNENAIYCGAPELFEVSVD